MDQPIEGREALQRELLLLHEVLDNVGGYVFTKDLAGRYTYVNEMVCQLFGLPREHILGADDSKFFDLDVSNELRRNDRQVMENGVAVESVETNVVKCSGLERIYWTVKKPVRDGHGQVVGMCGISTDITERKRLEMEVERQRQMLDAIVNNVDAYCYIKTRDRRFLYANQQAAALFGQTPDAVVGKRDIDLMPVEVADHFWEMDRQVFETGQRQCGEEDFVQPGGNVRHYWTVKVPLCVPGQPEALIGFSTDISALHTLKEELYRQAHIDALTGVANRRHFFAEAESAYTRAQRYQQPLAVIMLDIDHFKRINDSFGHRIGDSVIQAVASHCQQSIRAADLLGRIGGEEFAILLPMTDQAEVQALAERLCGSLRQLPLPDGQGGQVLLTASMGAAVLESADHCFDKLLERADQAMYRAKQAGRNQVHLAGPA